MAQPLKRTFHGCLTCRRRKVRCLGGSPCPNCSKMNIACHSSFDTNLRVRVATATGQKDLQTKSPTRKSDPLPQVAPVACVPTLFDGGVASALTAYKPSNTTVDTKAWGLQNYPSAPSCNRQGTDFDSGLLSEPWSFGIPPPASPSFHVASYAQTGFPAAESSIYSPLYLDPSAMGIPYFQPSSPSFGSHSEASSFVDAQSQAGLRGMRGFNTPQQTTRGVKMYTPEPAKTLKGNTTQTRRSPEGYISTYDGKCWDYRNCISRSY